MRLLSRPGFYLISLLIAVLLLLTGWMQWKLDTLPKLKSKQEAAPVAVPYPP
ncbi:MAG: hypothetical protein JNM65_19110 [Verrucomicrobiaceae bacterium]|nr:hypothetical protein [Verrucomicrobiaceae bacterium]